MLRNTSDFVSHAVSATDGPIGQLLDFYFDDDAWVIRYLVVDTGAWLPGRKALVSPVSVADLDGLEGPVRLSITRKQLRHCPGIETGISSRCCALTDNTGAYKNCLKNVSRMLAPALIDSSVIHLQL